MSQFDPQKPKKDKISIPLILILLWLAPPVGLLLAGLRLWQEKQERDKNAAQNAWAASAYPAPPPTVDEKPRKSRQKAAKNNLSIFKNEKFLGTALLVLAALLAIGGVGAVLENLRWLFYGYGLSSYELYSLVKGLFSMGAAGASFLMGRHLLNRLKLRRRLWRVVGSADNMDLHEIARALETTPAKAEDLAQDSVDRGDFGPAAYVEHAADWLVVRGALPAEAAARTARFTPASAPVPPAPEKTPAETQDEYDRILRQLRAVNASIPNTEMSAKITRLETVASKIFKMAREHPEKARQLNKFMNYYLPTSLKLLTAYAQLDAQGLDGGNIGESKRRIEGTMDLLCDAFDAQLDKLFTSEALDISTDIAAMEAMLKADGLADDGFLGGPGLSKTE